MAAEPLPHVRLDLRRTQMVQDGRTIHIIKDPASGKYFRFGESEVWLMEKLDGTRTFEAVSAEFKAAKGARAPASTIAAFYAKLKDLGLTERTTVEKSLLLMEMLRRDRKARLKSTKSTLFRMRFSWGDPDRLFTRMVPRLGFFWTPAFVWLSVGLFVLYGYLLVENWSLFTTGFQSLYNPATYTLGFIISMYMTGVVVFVIHEFGHGLTCKRFGGEVHEMGAMLLYFMPAFYCNVNDAYTFEKRKHRLWVTFAGGWIQLVIAALAAIVWALTDPATWVHRMAFVTTLLAGGMSVLINYNPLLPLDGYYTLVDWLGIPNLRPRAMELVRNEAKRRILRMKAAIPALTKREYRILLVYGILAFAYTFMVLSVIGHWAGSLAVRKLGGWGWVLIAFVAWRLTGKLRPRVVRFVKTIVTERMPTGRQRKNALSALGAVAAVVLLAFVVPWTVRVKGTALLEPNGKVWLQTPEPAWIDNVFVGEGDVVAVGQEIIRLRSPELEIAAGRARARVGALEREVGRLRNEADPAGMRLAEIELEAARNEWSILERRREALRMRAPFAGRIATPHVQELVGLRVLPGDSLIEVWAAGPMRVRVALSQRDAAGVTVGDRVRVRFPADAGAIWSTHVMQVGSATHSEQLELLAPLGVAPAQRGLHPGMVGQAKVAVQRTRVAHATWRGLRRLVRTEQFL